MCVCVCVEWLWQVWIRCKLHLWKAWHQLVNKWSWTWLKNYKLHLTWVVDYVSHISYTRAHTSTNFIPTSHIILSIFSYLWKGWGNKKCFHVGCNKHLFLGLNKKSSGLILQNTLEFFYSNNYIYIPYIILHMKVFCIISTYFTWMNVYVLFLLVELAKVTKVGTNVLLLTKGPWN